MNHTTGKHIVIDARFWRRSAAGLSTYSQQLVHGLAALDHVNRYTILITPDDVAEFDVVAPNVSALVVDIPHYSLAEQTRLPKVLTELKPDLVHFLHFNHPILYRGPFITTLHDLTVVYFPVGRQQHNPLRRWAFLRVMRDAVQRAAKVIAVSRTTRDDAIRDLSGDPSRIAVIHEGLALASRSPKSASALEELGVRSPYLLFVSQWRPHKRIEDLVEAFEQISAQFPKLQLVITGKPNALFPKIIDRVEHSPVRRRIITPGFVADELLPTLYAHAELFVFPSLYEGFGFPPLEAMAMGTPVVAANASCLPEILGNAAQYFEAGNVADLAATLAKVLDDPGQCADLAKRGKAQAAQYDWATVAKETLAVYESILGVDER